MIPDETLFCDLEQTSSSEQDLQRIQILNELGLLEPGTVPIFEEATQTAAHFLNAPICILSVLDRDRVWFKSAIGLSRIGLMNSLASSRQLPRQDAFCAQVAETQRILMLPDASADPAFDQSRLVQRYGICSYLGVPLWTSSGQCIGTLSVMGLAPRTFSEQEIAFLELIARWSMSEFERNLLVLQQTQLAASSPSPLELTANNSVKANLLAQMTQELCTPLTSVLGMAKVLSQGIYGSLSDKQQEYLHIIHNSGQYLLSLVNEIVELGNLDDQYQSLTLGPIDIEMLCQQAISALDQAAQRRDQKIQLSVEPGNRIWLLDKDKVRHMLYHLVFSVIQASSSGSIIRIHVSRKQKALHLSVWASHPWLGEGLPTMVLSSAASIPRLSSSGLAAEGKPILTAWESEAWATADVDSPVSNPESNPIPDSRQTLGLALSRQLAELHSGDIVIQGSAEEGYRYVIRLPQMKSQTEPTSLTKL